MNLQAMLVRAVAEDAVVIVYREVAERLAEVIQEAVADWTRIHNAAGQDRKERQRIIAAALTELLAQRRRPVKRLDLPTVRMEILERAPRQRTGIGNERFDHRVPVALECARINPVQRVALPAIAARRDVGMVANSAAEPDNPPCASRNVPAQDAVLRELCRQVQHLCCLGVLFPGYGGELLEQRRGVRRGEA